MDAPGSYTADATKLTYSREWFVTLVTILLRVGLHVSMRVWLADRGACGGVGERLGLCLLQCAGQHGGGREAGEGNWDN